jgi:hypothetical protein
MIAARPPIVRHNISTCPLLEIVVGVSRDARPSPDQAPMST